MLYRAVVLTLLVASLSILWLAFRPPKLPSIQALNPETSKDRPSNGMHFTRPLNEFTDIANRRLGAPLYAPPAPPVEEEPEDEDPPEEEPEMPDEETETPDEETEPAPEIGLRVIGTVLEAGRSLAIVADEDGGLQVRGEGEAVETEIGIGEIKRIEYDQITILLEGETQTLKMP